MKKSYISLMTTICFLFAFATESRAQEYAHEIGGGIGSSFYMGDANKTKLFLNSHIAAGFVYRYNVDFHWAVKTGLAVGSVSGDTNKSDNVFPNDGRYAFKRQFVDLGGQIEFSVFPYSDKYAYLGTKPYTPYLFAGSGITFASGENNFFNANIPLGIGFKYKLKNRINLGIEFSTRKLFGDDLDVSEKNTDWNLNAPYKIKSGWLKNNDWLFLTLFYATWEFGLKSDPCNGR